MQREVDGGVRRLVLLHGRDKARAMVEPENRSLVDITAQVLADDDGKMGITYTGFCLTGLPHKRLADDAAWEKAGYRVRLLVEPGRIIRGRGPTQHIGVPYGARARMRRKVGPRQRLPFFAPAAFWWLSKVWGAGFSDQTLPRNTAMAANITVLVSYTTSRDTT